MRFIAKDDFFKMPIMRCNYISLLKKTIFDNNNFLRCYQFIECILNVEWTKMQQSENARKWTQSEELIKLTVLHEIVVNNVWLKNCFFLLKLKISVWNEIRRKIDESCIVSSEITFLLGSILFEKKNCGIVQGTLKTPEIRSKNNEFRKCDWRT